MQIKLFQKPGDTCFYFFQDLAFVPIQALVVTLVLNKLLNMMERRRNLKKVNVIISAFFSEIGTSIIYALSKLNENHDRFSQIIDITELNKKNTNILIKKINEFDFKIGLTLDKLASLGPVLIEKKSFMIGMLENSSLMEHDSFTDMLWAVFHVADELQSRDLTALSPADLDHLSLDVVRAYRLIIIEWVNYLKYLNVEYPYLFNLAVRKNPFSEGS
ncbi:hypothetical protein [Phosphitispora sp. TUW77]|uniref:hypothetical protein n=1 Tax=Phosphitispora sp. TUW77 TaxID=3152361 RepID=UPI003AB53EB0